MTKPSLKKLSGERTIQFASDRSFQTCLGNNPAVATKRRGSGLDHAVIDVLEAKLRRQDACDR